MTPREVQILALFAEGRTIDEVAEVLHIARGTVRAHTLLAYAKLGTHTKAHAVAQAMRLGVIS